MKRIEVAAAIVRDGHGRFLLSKRPDDKHQGGRWEFPGGKIEAGETPADALVRELLEELDLRVTESLPFLTIEHSYDDLHVRLCFREVTAWRGEPRGLEGQPVEWFGASRLGELEFPAANRPVVTALSLPERVAIWTPAMADRVFHRALARFSRDGTWIYLRGLEREPRRLAELAAQCRRAGTAFLVADDAELASRVGASALHLTAAALRRMDSRPDFAGPLSVACHGREELERALRLRADMALLSPVAATPTHPEAAPLGWDGFRALAEGLPLSVYALGGVAPDDLVRARENGARGVAGIRAFWPDGES